MFHHYFLLIVSFTALASVPLTESVDSRDSSGSSLIDEKENHFQDLQQLTFGGQNAEAYFSSSEREIIFQSTRDTLKCDQQFIMDLNTRDVHMVSTGHGRTTCGYFFPGDTSIL